jgi:hypothetical protein
MKLAEALLLRKQLAQKVEQLKPIKTMGDNGMFDSKMTRKNVSESVDEITVTTPKISLSDLTRTFDHYSTQLRKLDAMIQRVNWETEIAFDESSAVPEDKG